MYYLIDLGSTLFYVTLFMDVHFGFGPEYILDPFSISTPASNLVVARRVYRGCVVSVGGREMLVDLFELDMLDLMLSRGWTSYTRAITS